MLSYEYYLNTVTRTVSKHTAVVLSCYHMNITLTQSHVTSVLSCYNIKVASKLSLIPSQPAAIQPMLSLCAVIRFSGMVGKFCDLLHDNGMGFVSYNRSYFFPSGVEREGGGGCCSAINNSKFYKRTFYTHYTINCFLFVTSSLAEISHRNRLAINRLK